MAGKVQQYVRAEYIQPPPGPPTLDAKNSPLALLAQTCSAIGKEPASTSKHALQTKRRYPTSINDLNKTASDLFNKLSSCSSPSTCMLSPSPSASKLRKSSSSSQGHLERENAADESATTPPAKRSRASPELRSEHVKQSSSVAEHKKSLGSDVKRCFADVNDPKNGNIDTSSTRHKSPSCSPSKVRSSGASCRCPMSSSPSTDAARPITQNSPQEQLMSLYDPYCLGCQGSHMAGTPCLDNLKSPHSAFYGFGNPASAYPFYAAQMVMAATARYNGSHVDPSSHVCNWMSGNGSCGRRFSTSEDLFTHLRTHITHTNTNGVGNCLSGLEKMAVSPYAAYFSQQAAALAAVSPATANPIASNFLSRNHSPLNRYQPYKSTGVLSQIPGLPSLPIPAGVGPFYSPYALYGQRLNASAIGFSYP